MWEAQFGDFANGAQIIVDQFLATAEDKWGQRSRLVMLLPHGYEGQGPEHSSARVERFLQLCAGGNLQVACPSTPAQYFHLLRRQAALAVPKPLVILTPKSLLRHPRCVSAASDLVEGRFAEVLDDPAAPPGAPRLVLAAGKLHYDLMAEREARGREDLVLARVEQFYPWPKEAIAALLDRHGRTRDVVWAQEEPRNMGGWVFVEPRLRSMLPAGATLTFVGRPPSPSPATGSHRRHVAEQDAIVKAALGA
jgi:2-oxoglutarate dehydrogenase E1 component